MDAFIISLFSRRGQAAYGHRSTRFAGTGAFAPYGGAVARGGVHGLPGGVRDFPERSGPAAQAGQAVSLGSESVLIGLVRAGDPEAMAVLYERYRDSGFAV